MAVVGSAIDGGAVLLGALVGGVLTYLGAKAQTRLEYRNRKWDALRAAAIEISHNQPLLHLDFDRILPYFLARAHRRPHADQERLGQLIPRHAPYRSTVYDRFFTELVSSRLGSELTTYYGLIGGLNARPRAPAFSVEVGFGHQCTELAHAILLADDLLLEIRKELSKSRVASWGRNIDFDETCSTRERYLIAAQLVKFRLADLVAFLEGKGPPRGFPRLLAEQPEKWSPFVDAARQV
ncbi:MAG: hypothetical protein ACK40O_05695 [Allosphingosinicella sp.]